MDNWASDAIDWIMDNWAFLPIVLTEDHSNPVIRCVGVAVEFVWFIPAMFVALIPLAFLVVATTFIDAWQGNS